MKLKGIGTIALLVAAILLVIGSVAGIVAATDDSGGDEPLPNDEGRTMDASYWWEDERWKEGLICADPYYVNQIKELWIFIFDHYFGMDISRMTFDKLETLRKETGDELLAYKAARHWKDPVLEKPIADPLPPQPYPCPPIYWWEIIADPEGRVELLMKDLAELKGMAPQEVSERFNELFPGVDIWGLNLYEFMRFVNEHSPPLPPRRPVCFEELRERPLVIGLFGRVPDLQTEEQLEEFTQKLHKVLDVALPVLRQLPRCEFPFAGFIVSSGGAINVAVHCLDFPMEEVYEIIGDKAEMFGIEDVPVVFNDGRGAGPQAGPTWGDALGLSSSGWRPPWNEPYPEIPGAVKVTPAGAPARYTTASFAVLHIIGMVWDPRGATWDADLLVSGHKGPDATITPIHMPIRQPVSPHAAGWVADNVGPVTYADAARVAICDTRVKPSILFGGSASQPVFQPVFDARDPKIGDRIFISAGRTGLAFEVTVEKRYTLLNWWPWEELRDQFLVRPIGPLWTMGGDSGSPYWAAMWCPRRGLGARIHGVHYGWVPVNGVNYMVMSPVSGILREFPKWFVWTGG